MAEGQYEERVIAINRVAKVVKGGRRFSFTALVVVGDGARQRRASATARRRRCRPRSRRAWRRRARTSSPSPLAGRHHHPPIIGEHDAARVLLKPAAPGTGVIAGGAARAILEAAGVHDVLAKSLGSSNAINVSRATINGPARAAPARRGRAAARQVARRGRHRRDAARLPRAQHEEDRSHRGRVTWRRCGSPRCGPRSASSRSSAARCARSACAASTTPSSTPDRPEIRGHGRPGAAPRRRRRGLRHEGPRPEAAARVQDRAPARRPRHRRQGRQDRRPRHQGPGRARQRRRPRFEGGQTPIAPPHPEGQGVQEPVPGRVRGGQPRHARGASTPAPRSTPACCARTASWPSAAW